MGYPERMNVWVTLNPPDVEVNTGVSMQMSSRELNYSALRYTSGHVRQARRYECYELSGSCVVDISRTYLFVGLVWQVRMDLLPNSHWVMLHV